MFHKFKITTCAFILCLFGLTLTPHAQPLAYGEGSQEFIDEFDRCKKKSRKNKTKLRERKDCFGSLARTAATEDLGIAWDKVKTHPTQLRKDFKKCQTQLCKDRTETSKTTDYCSHGAPDDIDEIRGYETYAGANKKEIKEAMHCYGDVARILYDQLCKGDVMNKPKEDGYSCKN